MVQYAPEQTGVGFAATAFAVGVLMEMLYRKVPIRLATTNPRVRLDAWSFDELTAERLPFSNVRNRDIYFSSEKGPKKVEQAGVI